MSGCVERSGLNLGDLFTVIFAEILVNSGFMCIFNS